MPLAMDFYNFYRASQNLNLSVRIVDFNGRTILQWNTTSMVENVNVSDLSAGIYLVEISQGDVNTVVRLAVD